MAIDVRGLTNEYPEWGGLYKMADSLERRQLRKDQLATTQATKRNSTANFLAGYLDPKDYLSGTAHDPMILQGIEEAMQHGSRLAASGADNSTLLMALGPMVNKLSTYSANAKNINKQVDDAIAGMRADKQEGYDWAKLKQEALNRAFYKPNAEGAVELDPTQADPSVDWIGKVIEESPEKVTTAEGFDVFAKNAGMKTTLQDEFDVDKFGNSTRRKVNLTAQNYLQPVVDKGKVRDFVPMYTEASDDGEPLMHLFTDKQGNQTKAPVRLLDKKIYEGLPKGMKDYIRGQVKTKIKEYQGATGEEIPLNSAKAELVGLALAYDEFNRPTRKTPKIEYVNKDNLSPQQISLNVGMTPEALQNVEDKAAAGKRGRLGVTGGDLNVLQTVGQVFKGDADLSQIATVDKNGRKVYDVTQLMPGGGLKAGRGADYDFKGIYFDPRARELVVDKETTDRFNMKSIKTESIPEKDIGKFLYQIAESNGVNYTQVRQMLDEMGYKNGKFQGAKDAAAQMEFEERAKKKSWRETLTTNPFGAAKFNP